MLVEGFANPHAFSYSKDMKQNQVRILIGGIIVLTLGGLFFYFRKDFSKLINPSSVPMPASFKPDFSKEKYDVVYELTSFPGAKISLENQVGINHVLNRWKIFTSEEATTTNDKPWIGVNKININFEVSSISSELRRNTEVFIEEDPINSNGEVKLKIIISKKILGKLSDAEALILKEFLISMYSLKNPKTRQDEVIDLVEKTDGELRGYFQKYFVIRPK